MSYLFDQELLEIYPEFDAQGELEAPKLKPTPQEGHFYRIQPGDTLFQITSAAYKVKPGPERLKLARLINDDSYNLRFRRPEPVKFFPKGIISFYPQFHCDPNKQIKAKGKPPAGNCYAVIRIPKRGGGKRPVPSQPTSICNDKYLTSQTVSYDRYIENEYFQHVLHNQPEAEAEAFVVENKLLRIPPGHETINREAAKGLPISSTELNAMNRGVRRVDTEKLTNHFKPSQQRRHVLRRYKCQKLEEALAEARQQLIALHKKALTAPRRENAFEWIGEALHLIQDSYSPAHTVRENGGTGAITFIRYYNIDGLPYPTEHRVFPMRQPGRLIPLPVDPRDYVNIANPPERAAIAASRDFVRMMLTHLGSPPPGFTATQWNTQRCRDLVKFMNKYLILSPRRTPTKTFYPSCP